MFNIRVAMLANAERNVTDLGAAVSEQTTRSVQSVDIVLLNTLKDIDAEHIDTPEKVRTALGTEAVHDQLVQEGRGLPQESAFTIIDVNGQLVNFSRRWPVPPTNLADRPYFKYFAANDDKGSFISQPVQNRGDGTWTVYVVRRIDGPHGQFLGLVLGALDLGYFHDFYQKLATSNGFSMVLMHRNGQALVCYPGPCSVGQILFAANSPWYRIVAKNGNGMFVDKGLFEPGQHLVSVHTLSAYPLVVNVCLSKRLALAVWRREALLAAGGTLCAILAMLMFLRMLALQLQRLERSEMRLAQRNRALVESEEKLRYLAHYDDLTKLMNRRRFRDFLEDAVAAVSGTGSGLVLLYLDLDRFKLVNDTMGHTIGDKVLVAFAERLNVLVGGFDYVARTGGDEFAIIQQDIDREDAERLARDVMGVARGPFVIDGIECRLSISVGIAHYPDHASDAGALMRNADTALYRAKAAARGSFFVFDEVADVKQQELFVLEQEIKQALELDQFEVEYQPIIAAKSGRIVACETLLRWRHPARGLVPPGDFIAMTERLRLIIPIGYWVFETACREAASWPEDVAVAINLSPVQFNEDDLVERIAQVLAATKLPPHRLILEVTEGLLLDDSTQVRNVMHRLRSMGVKFNLDDFGTGHSGLSYLCSFPFDGIKIDKMFVQEMADKPEARAVVMAVLTVAAALDLDVIGEGVETAGQLSNLRTLGCGYVQGYLTGRPQPARALRERLREMNDIAAETMFES